uniref:Predicted protein n=1 Tax=Hordeum vulgare subsp. vulgare TaxID=112509 RepID=F2CWT8_HORVV|nr:predicted protein [Hordeum vulgare subsp. vulgare]
MEARFVARMRYNNKYEKVWQLMSPRNKRQMKLYDVIRCDC